MALDDLSRWEEIPELKNWLQEIKPSTRPEYLSVMRIYQKWSGMNAKQLIDEAEEDWKKPRRERGAVKRRLLSFYDYLVNEHKTRFGKVGISPYRAKKIVEGHLASFYKRNGFPQIIRVRNASPRKENFRVELSREDVRRMYNHTSSLRNKAILLCGFQALMDAKTVTLLDVGDLPRGLINAIKASNGNASRVLEMIPTPWLLHITRRKSELDFHTCIGRDGAEAIVNYLWERMQREEEITESSPLFIREERGLSRKDGKIRRIREVHIHNFMREIAVDAGIISQETLERADINPCGFHALRIAASKILEAAGMQVSYVEYMMGHVLPHGGVYRRPNPKVLRDRYRELEHHVSITYVSSLTEMEEKLKKELEKRDYMIKGMEEKIKELELKIEALTKLGEMERELIELVEMVRERKGMSA